MSDENKLQTPLQAPQTAQPQPHGPGFDEDLIKKYPRANRKIVVDVAPYSLAAEPTDDNKAQTLFISPHGMEFQGTQAYPEGTLLKIHISLPDYWNRKQQFVEYRRVDTPGTFKILAKVVRTEDVGKRGKKKLTVVQTVNMDEVDEQVLKSYLQDG
jgi:hypothetical protein